MTRSTILLAGCSLWVVACGGAVTPPASSAPAEADDELFVYDLVWDRADVEVPTVEVRFSLDLRFVEPAPEGVVLYFAPLELADGDSSGTRFLAADAPGEVDAAEGRVRWPVIDGVARGRYRVTLEHARHDPVRGVDNVPHPTAGGWSVPGVALLPSIARLDDGRSLDGPARLRTELPAGWSHRHSAGVDDASRVESFAELAFAIHTFGRYAVSVVERGESQVRLLSADYDADALAPLRALVDRALTTGEALLGPLAGGALTIVVDRVGEEYEGGLVGTQGVVLSGPDLGSLRANEMPGLIVVHELGHFWARADEPWLNEGLARLLEIEMGTRLEDLDGPAATAELRERIDRYHALAGGSRRVADATVGAWPYEGGLAVLLCTEASLRAEGHSLLEVHRELRARDGLPVRVAAFRAALDARVPGLGEQLDGWLTHEGPIPLAPCLNGLGFDARVVSTRVPTARAIVVEILGARGLDTDAMRITAVAEGSALREGDVILRLDDARVSTLDALAWALRGRAPGGGFALHVRREDAPVTLTLTMPELGEAGFREVEAVDIEPGEARGRLSR
ncbi:MAG: PDZ domain-containing protein [Myxococcales bacterium]|nr:PDZ domain-containing protein [Myxococcales bacterium]